MDVLDLFFKKFSYKFSKGYPDMNNEQDILLMESLIKKHIPEFSISYKPDFRQAIADSWPQSIDDTEARKDWGWKEKYDLPKLVENMIANLGKTVAA